MNLKALEILKKISKEINDDSLFLSEDFIPNLEINEAINELEQYEQNFKDKEFKYRTECQNVLSAGRIEADNMPDRLAELEKAILDYYLAKGYVKGTWCFNIGISTYFKSKALKVVFFEKLNNNEVFETVQYTNKEMFDEAIKHFSLKIEPTQDDRKPEVDDTNHIYKVVGYESDGRE